LRSRSFVAAPPHSDDVREPAWTNEGPSERACKTLDMIRGARLGEYDFVTSALGFGTAGMFHEPSREKRRALIETAVEAGIMHFDVAPIYGLGLAETELGRALRRHRDNVVIVTKVGIGLTPLAKVLGRLQGPVRSALRRSPRMQERARGSAASPSSGTLGGVLYESTFDRPAAQRSLEQSVRNLGTHIDLLLLHDPEPAQIDADEMHDFLERARRDGHIRSWGVAGEAKPLASVVALLDDPTPVVQVRDDIFRDQRAMRSLASTYEVTFGTLGYALPSIMGHVNSSDDRVREWSEAVDADCSDASVVAGLLLCDSLRTNAHGTVLYSTTRPERLRVAAALSQGDLTNVDPSLETFRELVRSRIKVGDQGTSS
jgi:D-threo-aldose 1-dehydrogenase